MTQIASAADELSDAKRLLSALHFIINETMEDGDDHQGMMFGLIDAITARIDAAD